MFGSLKGKQPKFTKRDKLEQLSHEHTGSMQTHRIINSYQALGHSLQVQTAAYFQASGLLGI